MTARQTMFLVLVWLAAICLMVILALAVNPARAQVPDHFAGGHWYEQRCCSGFDCEPLPPEAVEDVRGGWRVRYLAKRGLAVDAFVPAGKERDSQDGRFHGCATFDRFLCLYVPRVS